MPGLSELKTISVVQAGSVHVLLGAPYLAAELSATPSTFGKT